jgi:hypothetical protein
MFGVTEGVTGVTGSVVVVVVPTGAVDGTTVGTACGGVAALTVRAGVADASAGVVIEVTGGTGVADAGACVVIEVTGGAGVADAGACVVIEVIIGAGVPNGAHMWNFDATATATITAQINAPKPASNFQGFHVGITAGATNFRLWRVTSAPALSRSSWRICRACSSNCRPSATFPSQIAFVPS